MASVEGVAIGPTLLENFLEISPVFVYLLAWLVYSLAPSLKLKRKPIQFATATTFNFHLAWIAGCTIIFVLSSTNIPAFSELLVGQIVFAIGDWLSFILLAILFGTWWWRDTKAEAGHDLTNAG